MGKKFGFDLLEEQALNAAAQDISMSRAIAEDWKVVGDSPIEKLFNLALCLFVDYEGGGYGISGVEWVTADELEQWILDVPHDPHMCPLLIEKQVEIDGVGRVDFVIHFYAVRSQRWEDWEWRRLVVECDGHDFHERTKEQAARDRGRDRSIQRAGLTIFRFTGSELWRDPWACAEEVLSWMCKQ